MGPEWQDCHSSCKHRPPWRAGPALPLKSLWADTGQKRGWPTAGDAAPPPNSATTRQINSLNCFPRVTPVRYSVSRSLSHTPPPSPARPYFTAGWSVASYTHENLPSGRKLETKRFGAKARQMQSGMEGRAKCVPGNSPSWVPECDIHPLPPWGPTSLRVLGKGWLTHRVGGRLMGTNPLPSENRKM